MPAITGREAAGAVSKTLMTSLETFEGQLGSTVQLVGEKTASRRH